MLPICDLLSHTQKYKNIIHDAISRVIDRGWYILGPEVKEFEKEFANYIGAKHCVSVANGTDALEFALRSLNIGENDYVATVANAGMYTTTAILTVHAKPIYMDVDFHTRVVLVDEIKRVIKLGVKAIVVTHLFGQAIREIEEISDICKYEKVFLVEDCAQAHGATINRRRVGVFGDIGCFSFYPTKNLGALGDGGAVVTNNESLANKVKLLRQYGWKSKYLVEETGSRNSRLDEIQAAVLLKFLPFLDEWNRRRREIAKKYSESITHPLVDVEIVNEDDYVAHLYVIRSEKRELLREHLQHHGIASDIHYPIPDYRQKIFDNNFSSIRLVNTERLCNEILTLPCYPEMTDAQVDEVVSAINGWGL